MNQIVAVRFNSEPKHYFPLATKIMIKSAENRRESVTDTGYAFVTQ